MRQEQIDLVSAWEECGDLVAEREQAALRWTEQNTHSEDEALALTVAVAANSTWNRIAIPMRRPIRRVATST